MHDIKAIAFDFFNTLITVERSALKDALGRLTRSLGQSGVALEEGAFKKAHREAALRFIQTAHRDGRETHNSLWISAALEVLGYNIPPRDPRISAAVEAYFSAFFDHCRIIPGTREMLDAVKGSYRLGLLSNFTHAPAAKGLIRYMGLAPYFEVALISGDLGYRKPHPFVFSRLIEQLGVDKTQTVYVGDDPEPDITGANQAGIHPVWFTYVRDRDVSFVPGDLSGSVEEPWGDVPRISEWEEFPSLLKGL